MLERNQFFQALKSRLRFTVAIRFVLIAFTSALFPIGEGILIALWSSAQQSQSMIPGVTLLLVGVLHLFCVIALLLAEIPSAELALARATEVEASAERDRNEMKRRSETYKMIRECLSMLTQKTCDLPRRQEPDTEETSKKPASEWCQAGFEAGLRPIVRVVLDNISTTLGVIATQYSIEVHLKPGYVLADDEDEDGLILRFFYGLNVRRDAPARLTNDSPARIGALWDVPNQSHINDNPAVFFENGSPKQRLYFRRFATSPITEPCSDIRMGVMVLTSMQDAPFADDVCDTLQFVASIVSNYVSAYCECRADYERHQAIRQMLPSLSGDHQRMLMDAMGMVELPLIDNPDNHRNEDDQSEDGSPESVTDPLSS